jgi:hypothetical protein
LFIGNSYTYSMDIPGVVQAMAAASDGTKLVVTTVAGPDMALIDHWNDGRARRAISARSWAWVVMQQGPSSTALSRDTLRLATRLFDGDITRVGARAVLWSAWPAESRRLDYPRAIDAYTLAAEDVNGILLPVAAAWLEVLNSDASIALYADGLHPSRAGAYLTALVIYARLLNQSPRGLPSTLHLASGATLSVDPQMAAVLQEIAERVVNTASPRSSRAMSPGMP